MSAPPKLMAVLWDVDGTLADSEPVHERAMREVLRSFDIDSSALDGYVGLSEDAVHANLRARFPQLPALAEFARRVHAWFLGHLAEVGPFAASASALQRYAAQGRRQAAVSNSPPELVAAMLEHLGMAPQLECVISYDGKGAPKPSPEPYQRALDCLGCSSAAAIAIEDSKVGCASARAAGLFVVGLQTSFAEVGAQIHFATMPSLDPEELVAAHA